LLVKEICIIMVRVFSWSCCAALTVAFRTHQESFPTNVWEEVTHVTCDQLEDRATGRMGKYRGSCGVGAEDMDSGAAGFVLLRSGARKLCNCESINLKQLREDRAHIQDQQCSGGIFGPVGEMDRIYDECKAGTLDLSQFADGDGKLNEDGDQENDVVEEVGDVELSDTSETRTPYAFSGAIRFTHVGGSTNIGGDTEYCLTVMNDAVTTVGSEVYGSACKPGNNAQVWYYNLNDKYESDNKGQLRVGPELLCLEQTGDSGLVLADCNSNNAQGWKWMNGIGKGRMIQSKKSHRCLGLRYATDAADGKKVTSWACKKDKNQAVQLCNKESKEGCAGYVW